jgi:S-adenosylmethionine hydrolase
VILGLAPAARLLDLTHQVPPQDVRHAAFFLAGCVPYFPPGTLHVVVVDPGVGTERAALHVQAGAQALLVPDNGCWVPLVDRLGVAPKVTRLADPQFWRRPVSATFHGRDVFAPVAGHLARGLDPARLGPPLDHWVKLTLPEPSLEPDRLAGEVIFIDDFGNLLTNIPGDAFLALAAGPVRVRAGPHEVGRRVRTYGEAEPGTLVSLVSSSGTLEIAVARGNAARQLGVGVGAPVTVTR